MGVLAVIFSQPALCNFPYLMQRSEQIKIQYFCPVRPVESFDKGPAEAKLQNATFDVYHNGGLC